MVLHCARSAASGGNLMDHEILPVAARGEPGACMRLPEAAPILACCTKRPFLDRIAA